MQSGATYVQKLPSGKVGFVRRPIKIKQTKSILADAFLPNRDGSAWSFPYSYNLDAPLPIETGSKETTQPIPLTDGPAQAYNHGREYQHQLATRRYDLAPSNMYHPRPTQGRTQCQQQRQDTDVQCVDATALLRISTGIRLSQGRYLLLACAGSADSHILPAETVLKAMSPTGDLETEDAVEGGAVDPDLYLTRSLLLNQLQFLRYFKLLHLKPASLRNLLLLLLLLLLHQLLPLPLHSRNPLPQRWSPLLISSTFVRTLLAYVRYAVREILMIMAFQHLSAVLIAVLNRATIRFPTMETHAVLAAIIGTASVITVKITTIATAATENPGSIPPGSLGASMMHRSFHLMILEGHVFTGNHHL
ncbi:hypothetical protein TESG_03432 [Trichophyton tonsurans CBS 112818]|uniref:Uncharacterized protein n=1 Tax=Trichophyton tonsurans (strain CBS 112818) TaxID=647933 RepID=F2RX75_TRIT1|nr:hypothetical protein TESG_03432 [Trichophyton tonsurans CBS 112818]